MRLLLLLAVATPLRSAPQYGGSGASVPALQPPAPQVSQQCRTEQQVRQSAITS